MDEPPKVKSLVWIGSSRTDVKAFPAEVKDVVGYALYRLRSDGRLNQQSCFADLEVQAF
jgi:phage-related protein